MTLVWIRRAGSGPESRTAAGFTTLRSRPRPAAPGSGRWLGLNPKTMHLSGYLGTFMVLIGLLVSIIGFAQHRAVLLKVEPPPGAPAPSRSPHVAAATGCALVCALLAIYLATNAT